MPSTFTTDPIPAWVRVTRPAQSAPVDKRAEAEAQRRRRRIQAAKGENIRSLMRAPQSSKG